ncbi:MAG: tape measure protein [Desulfomicrobium sp.]|nr:tape measure protein [Desulfomicrobium sp.]
MSKREVQVTITANVSQAEKKLNELAKTLEQSFKMRSGQGIDSVGQSLKFLGHQSREAIKNLGPLKGSFESLRMAGGGLVGAFRGLGLAMKDSWKESKEMAKNMDSIDKKAKTSTMSVKKFFGAFGLGFTGVKAFQSIMEASNVMQELNGRLATTEGSASAAARAMDSIHAVAQKTATGVRDVAEIFMEFSASVREIGVSQKEVTGLTENMAKIFKLSGMGASQSKSAITTLTQALQNGSMTIGQFNTLARNGGQTLAYLADMLGVSHRELREMAKAGELSAEKLLLLAESSDKINKDFAGMPATVGDAMTRIANAFIKTAGESEALRIIFGALAKAIEFVARNLNAIVGATIAVGIAAMVLNVGKLVVMFQRLAVTIGLATLAVEGFKKSTVILWAIGLAAAAIIWAFEKIAGHLGKFGPGVQKFKDQLDKLEESAQTMEASITGALNKVNTEIAKARSNLKGSLDQIAASFEGLSKIIDREVKNATEKINRIYAQEQKAIEDAYGKNVARYEKETALLISHTNGTLTILRTAAQNKINLIETEANVRRQAVAKMYDDEQERARALETLERGVREKKLQILEQMYSDYQSHIDKLNAEAEKHFNKVKELEEKKRIESLKGEDRIRELERRGMSEYQAYRDREYEIDSKLAKGKEALSKGQIEEAIRYSREAEQAASQLATSVADGDREIISIKRGVNNAVLKSTEAQELYNKALEAEIEVARKSGLAFKEESDKKAEGMEDLTEQLRAYRELAQEEITMTIKANMDDIFNSLETLELALQEYKFLIQMQVDIEEILSKISDLQAEIKETGKVDIEVKSNIPELQGRVDQLHKRLQEKTESKHAISDNANKVQKAIDNLKKPTSSTHTIYIKKVQKNALGGLIQSFASGGQAFKRAIGRVSGPGTSTSDSIPSMLSDGEFVIRASMVKKWGAAFFESLNAGFLPAMPQMAMGGAVAGAETGSNESLTVTFRAGELEAPVRISDPASKVSVRAFARELQRIKLLQGR